MAMAPESKQQQRIDTVAPVLRELVQQHDDNTYKEGVEALNCRMLKIIDDAGLVDWEVKRVEKVCTHPSNREKTVIFSSSLRRTGITLPFGMPLLLAYPAAKLAKSGGLRMRS